VISQDIKHRWIAIARLLALQTIRIWVDGDELVY